MLKIIGFAVLYFAYIVLVFIAMGLMIKYAYLSHLELITPPTLIMIGLLLTLLILIILPLWIFRVQLEQLCFKSNA